MSKEKPRTFGGAVCYSRADYWFEQLLETIFTELTLKDSPPAEPDALDGLEVLDEPDIELDEELPAEPVDDAEALDGDAEPVIRTSWPT